MEEACSLSTLTGLMRLLSICMPRNQSCSRSSCHRSTYANDTPSCTAESAGESSQLWASHRNLTTAWINRNME